MRWIPQSLLRRLYTIGSLKSTPEGFCFNIKNRLAQASITAIHHISINGERIPPDRLSAIVQQGQPINVAEISSTHPLAFSMGEKLEVKVDECLLETGKHQLSFSIQTQPFGRLEFTVEDELHLEEVPEQERFQIPRRSDHDFHPEAIAERQQAVEKYTHAELRYSKSYNFAPELLRNNIENFIGVAQVPLGIAGPVRIRGEHADGEFLIPLATTEGSLVASYNRGMKLINACGGARCTVTRDGMQRAPAFVFSNAMSARDFLEWTNKALSQLREIAESTSSYARLQKIETYQLGHQAFLRFVFSTGDAAGQNMVTRATFEACQWILENYEGILHFHLEANMATDKKHSHINVLQGRGKSVTAEIRIPAHLLQQHLGCSPAHLYEMYHSSNSGSYLSASSSNGLQAANALAAMFTATGQDIANVAESAQSWVQLRMEEEDNLFSSVTLPSLIIGTYGGGTGLPTQRECLELMDCYGSGKALKLAEIIAGVVLAGELSLAAAIASLDWVPAHERMGKNR